MKQATRAAILICSLASSCVAACYTPPHVRIATVLDEARQNELGAIDKYQGDHLRVSGLVVSNGLRPVATSAYRVTPWWITRGTEVESYPVVYLSDPSSTGGGYLVCYFEPSDLDKAASLSPGSRVTVEGEFGGFGHGPSGLELVLGGCKIKG